MLSKSILKGAIVSEMVFNTTQALASNISAKKEFKKQAKYVAREYAFNKRQLEDSITKNLEINFNNIASSMFDFTKQYITEKSSINAMTAKYGNGISYSSSNEDLRNSLENEFLTEIKNSESIRNHNEKQLLNQYNTNMYQLEINKDRAMQGLIDTSSAVSQQSTQKMFNSIVGGLFELEKLSMSYGGK